MHDRIGRTDPPRQPERGGNAECEIDWKSAVNSGFILSRSAAKSLKKLAPFAGRKRYFLLRYPTHPHHARAAQGSLRPPQHLLRHSSAAGNTGPG